MPERCSVCLEDRNVSGICMDCKSKLERAKADVELWKRQAEGWKRNYYRLHNEMRRGLRKRGP